MPSADPRAAAVLSALALASVLLVAAALAPPALARTPAPPVRAADPGYTIVPWANESVRILDSRVAWLPPLNGFTGDGLLLANDSYAAAPAAIAALASPAPNGGVALYDYGTGSTRNLSFPRSLSGAFSPGDVTPFTRNGRTYLLSLSRYGLGVGGSVTYLGADLQLVAASILDYPRFTRLTPVNLSVPLRSLDFAYNTSVGLTFYVTPDGANVSAIVQVGRYTGGGRNWALGPPEATYVYFVDLAQANWVDGQPLVLAPERTVSPSSPVVPTTSIQLTSSQLLLQLGAAWPNVTLVFYSLDRGTSTSVNVLGQWLVWHGRIGGNLYLLEDTSQSASTYTYALDVVTLGPSGDALWATTVWNKTFPRYTNDDYTSPVVTGDRLDVFLGKNGWEGGPSPTLTTIYSYDLVCGDLLSVTHVNLTVPLLNGMLSSLAYPALHDVALEQGFVAELTHGLVYPLDLPAIRDAAAAARGAPPCASCVYATYVTEDAFPHLNLLLEEQYAPDVFGSSTVTNLTAVQLTANAALPPPLPAPPGNCTPSVVVPGGGALSTVDVATIAGVLVTGTVLIVGAMVVLSGRHPRRRA